ncbi:MAG: hypothetical protein ACE5FD_11775, partial [Anaerolineae bacterium]
REKIRVIRAIRVFFQCSLLGHLKILITQKLGLSFLRRQEFRRLDASQRRHYNLFVGLEKLGTGVEIFTKTLNSFHFKYTYVELALPAELNIVESKSHRI